MSINPIDEGYWKYGDCWIKYRCGEYYPSEWMRSSGEHHHLVLPEWYDSEKWPGSFGGFTIICKGPQEFLEHVRRARWWHDRLPGGKPAPLIIGHHPSEFRPGAPGTWLSNPPVVSDKVKEWYDTEDMEKLDLEPDWEGMRRVARWKERFSMGSPG